MVVSEVVVVCVVVIAIVVVVVLTLTHRGTNKLRSRSLLSYYINCRRV